MWKLMLPLLAGCAAAETYYVAPAGSTDGDGSSRQPWPSVEYALSKTGGGHTIVLQPGFYRGPIRISRAYAGTQESPTVIKSEQKWKAVVAGSTGHGIYVADNCAWVVIDGLEVYGARQDGIKIAGSFGVVRNCWLHHNSSMGFAAHGVRGWTLENSLVEFNGQHVQFHHGVYADGDGFTVRNNVVRHNSGYGLQLYPSARNGVVVNNLVYGHARKGGLILACPPGGGNNVVANNTLVENAYGISVTSGRGEVIANNIIVGEAPLIADRDTRDLAVDYNLCRPECPQGEHGVSADPKFVWPSRGAFFLLPDSPAIARGAREHAPESDFWSRPRSKDAAPDLGAFPFVPYLATEESRAAWYSGWAYRFAPTEEKYEMPDFWSLLR